MVVFDDTDQRVPDEFKVMPLRWHGLDIADKPAGRKARVRCQRTSDTFRKEATAFGLLDDDRRCVGEPLSQRGQMSEPPVECLRDPSVLVMASKPLLHSLLPFYEKPDAVVAQLGQDKGRSKKIWKVILNPVLDPQPTRSN